jgi:hypothetical protein
MEGWVYRPRIDWSTHGNPSNYVNPTQLAKVDSIFEGHRLGNQLLPMAIARLRTEGCAPPLLYERGVPQFAPDADDTPDTHPLAVACCQPAVACC